MKVYLILHKGFACPDERSGSRVEKQKSKSYIYKEFKVVILFLD